MLRAGCAARARGRARRGRDPRLQRLPDHAVPLARRSTTARTSTAARWRTARGFALEIVRAIRARGRRRLPPPVQDQRRRPPRRPLPLAAAKGTTLEESIQVCQWLEEAGVDGFHVSSGSSFPHPRNPAGRASRSRTSSAPTTRCSRAASTRSATTSCSARRPLNKVFKWAWERPAQARRIEGINLDEARARQGGGDGPGALHRRLPDASVIAARSRAATATASRSARPLIANPDLVRTCSSRATTGRRSPCTYCNKCLINFIENPLGCYEESRFDSREEMVRRDPLGLRRRRAAAVSRMSADALFEPLAFRNLTSRTASCARASPGRFDDYDGTRHADADQLGAEVRARRRRRDHLLVVRRRTGAGSSSRATPRSTATSGSRSGASSGERVHEHGCQYIVQLAHGGRQRDIPGSSSRAG